VGGREDDARGASPQGGDGPHERRESDPEELLPSLPLDDEASGSVDLSAIAEMLGERYTPLSLLGEGAFGEVVRARDRLLGREVAVKRIRLEAFRSPGQLEDVKARFLLEAQVAARLRHPGIVTTHDIVSTPRSTFIVMELVRGRDLGSLLRERGRLRLDETLDLLGQVADALDHAHAEGVVHRDIKPANVMIEPGGRVRVMDFGIAKVDEGGSRTSTGVILGTPNYMSPEQARGTKVDARADVFSLGCVLYECLTGAKPFEADTVTAILLKVVMEPPPPVDFAALGLPGTLDGVLRRAMAKEPGMRFASPGELMEAARRAARGEAVAEARPVGPSGTLVAAAPPGVKQPVPARSSTAAPSGDPAAVPAPRTPARRISSWALPVLALAVAVAALAALVAQREPQAAPSPSPAGGSGLVVEETPGPIGRLFGQQPRLVITVPRETVLSLRMLTPTTSADARPGVPIAAELARPVTVEGHEALEAGARVEGRVASVEPAAEAGGRGRLTLTFDGLVPTDGARLRIESEPVKLTAPPPRPAKSQKKGLAGAWARVTSTVGDIVREVQGDDRVGHRVYGARAVDVDGGVEVELPAGCTLDVELTRELTVTRAQPR
jgi:tRNA A-37 threonylcarbamoyl transferase component Bud32